MDIFIRFTIYGAAGLMMETLWTGLGSAIRGDRKLRCTTYLWMFFVYGSALLLEPVHELIRPMFWVARGMIWSILIFIIEYISGAALKRTTGACPWDYSGAAAASVRGYIRLDFFPVWFGAGLIFERMHDFIK